MAQYDPEEIKELLAHMKHIETNMHNWEYVHVNADYLTPKQVQDALGQILSLTMPMFEAMRSILEIEALTTLDPSDLQ